MYLIVSWPCHQMDLLPSDWQVELCLQSLLFHSSPYFSWFIPLWGPKERLLCLLCSVRLDSFSGTVIEVQEKSGDALRQQCGFSESSGKVGTWEWRVIFRNVKGYFKNTKVVAQGNNNSLIFFLVCLGFLCPWRVQWCIPVCSELQMCGEVVNERVCEIPSDKSLKYFFMKRFPWPNHCGCTLMCPLLGTHCTLSFLTFGKSSGGGAHL